MDLDVSFFSFFLYLWFATSDTVPTGSGAPTTSTRSPGHEVVCGTADAHVTGLPTGPQESELHLQICMDVQVFVYVCVQLICICAIMCMY